MIDKIKDVWDKHMFSDMGLDSIDGLRNKNNAYGAGHNIVTVVRDVFDHTLDPTQVNP